MVLVNLGPMDHMEYQKASTGGVKLNVESIPIQGFTEVYILPINSVTFCPLTNM